MESLPCRGRRNGLRSTTGRLLAQARLASKSRLPGQRFETLAALGKVRQIEGPSRSWPTRPSPRFAWPISSSTSNGPVRRRVSTRRPLLGPLPPHPLLDVYARCDMDGNISAPPRRGTGRGRRGNRGLPTGIASMHTAAWNSVRDGRYLARRPTTSRRFAVVPRRRYGPAVSRPGSQRSSTITILLWPSVPIAGSLSRDIPETNIGFASCPREKYSSVSRFQADR